MENKHVKVSIGDTVKIEIPLIGDGKLVKIVEVFDIQGGMIHFTYMNGSGMCNISSVVENITLDYKKISLTRQNDTLKITTKETVMDEPKKVTHREVLDNIENWTEDDLQSHLFDDTLGFCGCGRPDQILSQIRLFLAFDVFSKSYSDNNPTKNFISYYHPMKAIYNKYVDDNTDLLLRYVLDQRGLMEHGGSVNGAWIEDDGKEYLKVLNYYFTTYGGGYYNDPYNQMMKELNEYDKGE